jgi:hypothetical protein
MMSTAAVTDFGLGGVSEGDARSAPQSLPTKNRGETLGVPPNTTVTLGTEPRCWTTPTPRTAAAAIHMDGVSQGNIESAPQSLKTNDSQSLTTKDRGESLNVTLDGSSLSRDEKNSSGGVPKKTNKPRIITTPPTATKVRVWIVILMNIYLVFFLRSFLHAPLLRSSLTLLQKFHPCRFAP